LRKLALFAAGIATTGIFATSISPIAQAAEPEDPPTHDDSTEVPNRGTYVHVLATASFGESLRFNNPFRLSNQLGSTGESISRTPLYLNLGAAAAMGNPNGAQHGLSLQWNYSLAGLPQHVITPGYLLLVDGFRPWLMFGRVGLPIVLNPEPNTGGELALGGAFMITAGLGVQAEIVGDIFYGAATWDKKMTVIPMLSLQIGIIADFEVLP